MWDESFLIPELSAEALWLSMSRFHVISQVFGQLGDGDSFWSLSLESSSLITTWSYRKRNLANLEETWKKKKRGFFFPLWKSIKCNPSPPLLKFLTCKIPKNRHSDTKIWERTEEHKSLFVDKDMTNTIPTGPFGMRKPSEAIPSKRPHIHVCVHTRTHVQISTEV